MLDVDFGIRIGATEAAAVQRIAIYLPDRDKHDAPVEDLDVWIDRVVYLLIDINDGCTQLPSARGSWMADGTMISEYTTVVYSFIRDGKRFIERLDEVVALLHRFGRYTKQNAVMVEFSGGEGPDAPYFHRAYFIKEVDYLLLDAA